MSFITIDGIPQLTAYVGSLSTTLRTQIQQRAAKTMQQGAQRIQNSAPVRTGNLRNSVRYVQGGGAGILAQITVAAPYAGFVEWGTFKMMGRNFVTPNFHWILQQLRSFK